MKNLLLVTFFCHYYLTIICCFASSPDQCGHENGGKICPGDLCCSHDGFCGLGDDFCEDCQNNCPNQPNPIPECGKQNGGKYCPDGRCCSQYGFCGHTKSYCGEGCQSNCTIPVPCPVDDHRCGVQNGGRICHPGLCCSSSGYCGTGETYCGSGCQNNCPNNATNPVRECGSNNMTCPGNKCCSQYGFCGDTDSYCSIDCFCESNCWPLPPPPPSPAPPPPAPTPPPSSPSPPSPSPGGDGVSSIITKELFEKMLRGRNIDYTCAVGFYKYEAFIDAANFFEGFGTTGDLDTRKRELAAFFGQTSEKTCN